MTDKINKGILGRRHGNLLGFCMLLVVLCVGCGNASLDMPARRKLSRKGFYMYVLPELMVEQQNFQESIDIAHYTDHCAYMLELPPAPLNIRYKNKSGGAFIYVDIGPGFTSWDWSKETQEVILDTEFSMDGNAVFYNFSANIVEIRFEDQLGIPVHIMSSYSITETVEMINQLEYVGPPIETVGDPWDCCGTIWYLNAPECKN